MVNLGRLSSGVRSVKSVKVTFRLPYFTNWGQSLVVCGSVPLLGSGNVRKGLLLNPFHRGDELIWKGSIAVSKDFECEYSYYVVDDGKNILRWEMGKKRKFVLPQGIQDGQEIELHDLWQVGSDAVPFRSAFKDVIFGQRQNLEIEPPPKVDQMLDEEDAILVQFRICCPYLEKDTSVNVLGNHPKLGQWKVKNGLKLRYAGEYIWEAECVVQKGEFPVKYRYGKCDVSGNLTVEKDSNRELSIESSNSQLKYIVLSDGMLREVPWRGAGVAIPMFSLRTESDLGVGEFLDLKLLVDWAVASGFYLVQLLPINDTSVYRMWWDSYPYSSLSVFALHPLYLRVEALSQNLPLQIKEEIQKARQLLNKKDVDYEATMAIKLQIAKRVFAEEKDSILVSSTFQRFFSENEDWLKPYAAFCVLRDFFETSDHSQWGTFSHYSEEKLEKIVSKDSVHYDTVCFHYYIQYHLHIQLSEAAEYARKNGVVLKGDLPIGVHRDSVDTWVYRNLFRMNTSCGSPPDFFNENGQNWGFPTYNWEEMSKDNYGWWRARLTQMAKYFTAYRIDHILGFFRIWEISDHALTARPGKFRPSIALSQDELEREGIWDFQRLTRPQVKQKDLQDKFGDSWSFIATNFLNEYIKDHYEFKEDSNTEKKIASKVKSLAERSLLLDSEENIRRNLCDLLMNLVLFQDTEDPRKFYPRFDVENTSSFKELDDHSKNVLRRLYNDYYFYRQDSLWRQHAFKTLPVLMNSSDMLPCGEDLGFLASCVHPVMQELGLVGLRIQRMSSDPGLEFGIPSQYSYMTVCSPSCHDCSTLRAWWEEDEERRLRFFKNIVGTEALPPDQCTPEVVYFILRQHLESPSMWAIFPLQDLLALNEEYTTRPASEETINDPTNPRHYWRYRAHVTLESLMKDNELTTAIKDLVSGSGRSYPLGESEKGTIQVSASKAIETPEVKRSGEKVHFETKLDAFSQKEMLAFP